jgi:hypothetical protein
MASMLFIPRARLHESKIGNRSHTPPEWIAAMLDEKEDRTDFVRAAVERELERRERLKLPGRKRRR